VNASSPPGNVVMRAYFKIGALYSGSLVFNLINAKSVKFKGVTLPERKS